MGAEKSPAIEVITGSRIRPDIALAKPHKARTNNVNEKILNDFECDLRGKPYTIEGEKASARLEVPFEPQAALAAVRTRGARLGGDRGYRPATGPDSGAAALVRRQAADLAAHRLLIEVEALQHAGHGSNRRVAHALNVRGVPTSNGGIWTHTTVARLLQRTAAGPAVQLN
jgi:hypothetical protein